VSLSDEVQVELGELEAAHRLRVPRVVEGAPGPLAVLEGREVVNFASNDYLGLARDPRLVRAGILGLEHSGAGVGSSRLIAGNHREHAQLELELSDWLGCDSARLFNSGYAANVGILTTLLRAGDVVFSDELNHASIIDGCRLSRAQIVVFRHADHRALEAALSTQRGRRRIVVSESLFSMDGDLADVAAIATLCRRHDAAFVLDEAHAIGVLGPEGRGVAAELGVVPDVMVGTFGKALGSFGAFAATSRPIADLLWNRARSLVFSTGLPPSVPAASRAAIEIIRSNEGDQRRAALATSARRLRELVRDAGGAAASPIVPLIVGDERAAMACAEELLGAGLFVQGIRPPTVPAGTARLRVGLTAAHTTQHIQMLAQHLNNAMRHRSRP
jgi:8-amino-7-oxononanoate synthase